jgi:thymidylate synthase
MKYRHEDGTPFSKEEFQQKLKTDKEFNDEFGNKGIDQISELIKQLKENPDSRRLLVSAWNISDLPHQVLPPCHYGFQVYTRPTTREEKIVNPGKYRAISLMWNQRSVDTGLGLSFNIASYSLLLMMIAKQVDMVPDEVIGNLGDVHLYLNHIEPIKEQLTREPYPLPTVKLSDKIVNDISEYTFDDIILENYKCHPPIKMPLSN